MERDQDQKNKTTVRDEDDQRDTRSRRTGSEIEARISDGEALQRYEY